jgi:hypothetical protein
MSQDDCCIKLPGHIRRDRSRAALGKRQRAAALARLCLREGLDEVYAERGGLEFDERRGTHFRHTPVLGEPLEEMLPIPERRLMTDDIDDIEQSIEDLCYLGLAIRDIQGEHYNRTLQILTGLNLVLGYPDPYAQAVLETVSPNEEVLSDDEGSCYFDFEERSYPSPGDLKTLSEVLNQQGFCSAAENDLALWGSGFFDRR